MLFRTTFLFVFCAYTTVVLSGVNIKLTNLICRPSPKYFHNHSCVLKAVNRYKAVAKMECLAKDKLTNLTANIALFARNSANIYNPFLINFTLNVCKMFDKHLQGPYGKITSAILTRYTNVNHSCPYTGSLIAKNLYVDASMLPFVLPQSSYKLTLNIYDGYPLTHIGLIEIYADILEMRNKFYPKTTANTTKG
ncbi:uncharacterized protein LOC142241187 [Haematobia irritans]|uniref:uncharacterized protein LOC142241187 n=1 Tax=Haematobia irritans TaxID=7368 RepID=UPI003F503872